MEVNITIFIQMIIFLMLFLFLSNVLFSSLDKIFIERKKHTIEKQLKINQINKEIKKQDIYINEQTFITLNKAKLLYKNLKNKFLYENKQQIKSIKLESKKRYKNIIAKLSDENNVVRHDLNKEKKNIALMIYKVLYNI